MEDETALSTSPYHTRRNNRMSAIAQMLQDSDLSGSEDELLGSAGSDEEDSGQEAGASAAGARAGSAGGRRSQFRGVSYDKKKRKWRVQIKASDCRVCMRYFAASGCVTAHGSS